MEANYARFLVFKNITWEYEPDLYTFPDNKWGIKGYVPDFKVYKCNRLYYYLELKGVLDLDSYNKMQLFKRYYPREKIYYVPWDTYKTIERHYKKYIPNWE